MVLGILLDIEINFECTVNCIHFAVKVDRKKLASREKNREWKTGLRRGKIKA